MQNNSPETPGRRRPISGLIVSKQLQFKMAVACSSLILLPSLIAGVTFTTDLALETQKQAEANLTAGEIANTVRELALAYGVITIVVFVICSGLSIFLSLKLSNGMIGPVHRLEVQVDGMLKGKFEPIPPLRKTDYLRSLGEKLNALAAKLRA